MHILCYQASFSPWPWNCTYRQLSWQPKCAPQILCSGAFVCLSCTAISKSLEPVTGQMSNTIAAKLTAVEGTLKENVTKVVKSKVSCSQCTSHSRSHLNKTQNHRRLSVLPRRNVYQCRNAKSSENLLQVVVYHWAFIESLLLGTHLSNHRTADMFLAQDVTTSQFLPKMDRVLKIITKV